ncbi:ABC transporter permease [Bosea sp. BK604]|uniref:ABC transporter permease n=1 Tax=Bosea sp. BK604 TaxID=2512180 RepID=UPI0010F29962|nr:ABC transporter permease [Bosea sp. BK604]TCR62513.1 peptide/nickel transport system permease protein [Bosea sp. BK604]
MIGFLIRRVLQIVPVAIVMCAVVFTTAFMLPGDPTLTILGENAPAAARAALRAEMGLDRPIPLQFIDWLGRALTGDLGKSFKTGEPVMDMLLTRIPVTLELTILAITLAACIGVPLGIIAALRRNSWVDTLVSILSISSLAMPFFWVGMLLIMLFTLRLGWLPPSGYVPFFEDPLRNLQLMIMPVMTVGMAYAALLMRQTRAAMIEVLLQDYVRTARAKGAAEPRIIIRHALRNALIPVITVIGLQFGGLIGGAVVTETVFALPGLGRMITNAIFERDYMVVQGAILVVVVGVILVNLVTDITYSLLDRRVQL